MPGSTLQLPLTLAVVGLGVVVGKVKESLDPVQGHLGLQEAIDHPREVVERKDEHANQGQGREYLSGLEGGGGGEAPAGGPAVWAALWTGLWREEQGSDRTEGQSGQSLHQS